MLNELYYIRIGVAIICVLKIGAHILFDYFDRNVQDGIQIKGAAGIGARYLFPIPQTSTKSKNKIISTINIIYISSIIFYVISLLFNTFWK